LTMTRMAVKVEVITMMKRDMVIFVRVE
jgi:hypothetical protein